jgi:hypothetical protein
VACFALVEVQDELDEHISAMERGFSPASMQKAL